MGLLCMVSGCAITVGGPATPDVGAVSAPVHAFLEALVDLDHERAYEQLTDATRASIPFESFVAEREEAEEAGRGLRGYELLQVDSVPGFSPLRRASVLVRLEIEEGEAFEMRLSLTSVDGPWRLELGS